MTESQLNDLSEIRQIKANSAAISRELKGSIPFSYEKLISPAVTYSMKAITIAVIVNHVSSTFHSDIAKSILSSDAITGNQRLVLASYFSELKVTMGEIKSAIIEHETLSPEEIALEKKFDDEWKKNS